MTSTPASWVLRFPSIGWSSIRTPGNAAGGCIHAHHAAHRHDAAMSGIAVDDHRTLTLPAIQPAISTHSGHRRGADIGEPGIGADHPRRCRRTRPSPQPGPLHDPGACAAGRRMQDGRAPCPGGGSAPAGGRLVDLYGGTSSSNDAFVIPAQAGIHGSTVSVSGSVGPGLRRDDIFGVTRRRSDRSCGSGTAIFRSP